MAFVDGVFDLTNETEKCWRCEDGHMYSHGERCLQCSGKGKYLKPGYKVRTKCGTCNGTGFVYYVSPKDLGLCTECKGTTQKPRTMYSRISPQEAETIFGYFDFDTPFSGGYSEFNEGYLGFGVVVGVTDYGRYKKLSEEEFRAQVKQHFLDRCEQCVHLSAPGAKLKTIRIRRGTDGWHAYPTFE